MKTLLAAALLTAAMPTFATDVGVSVSIGQPGFYGQIEIGKQYPRPALVYNQPVIVQQTHIVTQPLYLHVPPRHAKRWHKYCGAYGACGRPVYFVQDHWYNTVYAPAYRQHKHKHRHDHHEHRHDRHDYRDHGRDDRDRGHRD